MGANVLVEFENVFFNRGHFFFKLGAKNYFGIEKISYFGNYMDPWRKAIVFNVIPKMLCSYIMHKFEISAKNEPNHNHKTTQKRSKNNTKTIQKLSKNVQRSLIFL